MTKPHNTHTLGGGAHRARPRPLAVVGAFTALSTLAALGLSVTAAPALAATSHAAATAHTTATTGTITAPSMQRVTLVTGERIDVLTQKGGTRYLLEGAARGHGQVSSYQLPNGDRFDVPAEASPYLGRQFPLSLFDTSALIRSGTTGDARIPVTLSFAAGVTPTAPPGVTLTSTSADTATGYLTPQSTPQFDAGLRAAIGADVRAGRKPGAGTLFGGLVGMNPAGSFAAQAAASAAKPSAGITAGRSAIPHFPLHILQINATDLTGAPVSDALAVVVNTDSIANSNNYVPIADGIARVAVPAGDYFAVVSFAEFDTQGNATAAYFVTDNDFSVAATGVTAITVAESSATVPFTVTTPRTSTQDDAVTSWLRKDATGAVADIEADEFGSGPPQFFNAQPASKVGTLTFLEQYGAAGPATGAQYRYDLAYSADDVPAVQTHTVASKGLATVQQVFSNDPAAPDAADLLTGTGDQGAAISGGELYQGDVTQYLGVDAGGQWYETVFSNGDGTGYDDVRTFAAGHQYRIEWAHGPLAPNVGNHAGPQVFTLCFACASSAGMSLSFDVVSDSDPAHVGYPLFDSTQTHYTLYVNGTVAADADDVLGAEVGPPDTSAPTTYREVYDVDRTGNSDISQSTMTHTDLTFVHNPQSPGPVLPGSWACDVDGVLTPPCNIQPVLNLSYHLATDATNTSDAPVQALLLNVNHLSYDGLGSKAAITSAAVSVSFDGGKTWQPATVVGANGTYVALWQNPKSAAGTSPSIKVSATDAAGGSITQTTTNAYTLAPATS